MINEERCRRRGPAKIDASERRGHCVSVRLNKAELAWLDKHRGAYQRGEYLRMSALDRLPPTVPPINRDQWLKLSRASSNLNQLTRWANCGGLEIDEIGRIRKALADFRLALIGADLQEGEDKPE